MATSIFPEANAKIYLTASAESRAERRVKQLQGMGLDAKINDIDNLYPPLRMKPLISRANLCMKI
ncbi:(d)CMP kinase, partial [Klebsiella pneumoniae]